MTTQVTPMLNLLEKKTDPTQRSMQDVAASYDFLGGWLASLVAAVAGKWPSLWIQNPLAWFKQTSRPGDGDDEEIWP